MIALLLAQLVMPSPSVEPLSPPGMVCMGECSDGPMVWRASPARGRLVVACDMRSDTCSDGRKITTERATPVPCEVSLGVWETVGPDEGCYSVRGLESWAQTTSYLSYGAELDRSPWQVTGSQNTLTPLEEGGYRLCHGGDAINSGLVQLLGDPPEVYSLAVIGRRNTGSSLLLGAWNTHQITPLPDAWGPIVRANAAPLLGVSTTAYLYPRPGGQQLCIDLLGAWLTKSNTPGRPCWGGEAPVTCAADRHTISTEGWPTESGSISVAFKFEEFSEAFSIILDARTAPSSGFNIHYDRADGRLVHRQGSRLLRGPIVETERPYFVELRRKGPKVEMLLNGVLVASDDDWEPWSYSPIAVLGKHFESSNVLYVKGSISSLRVRSAE